MSAALRSPLLVSAGFAHGFSLRTEELPTDVGHAAGTLATDVGYATGALATDVGYAAGALFEVSQVHGAVVRTISASDEASEVRVEEADALVTSVSGVVVGVRVADCLPLLVADVRTGAVAAVHCGWRSVAASIVDRAVDALVAAGSRPAELRAAIGPHIRACCFEVGDEVVAALRLVAHGAEFVAPRAELVAPRSAGGKPHVELSAIVGAQLEARGVTAARRDDTGGCTRCDATRFYSYRRDGARAGRHHAVIVAR